MKKIIFLFLVILGFSCEKKDGVGEEIDFINFFHIVNEDSIDIFSTESFDTLDIVFKSESKSINWDEQKAINKFAREKLEWAGFGFANTIEEDEKQFVFDYLNKNPNTMVFYSNQIDLFTKSNSYKLYFNSRNQVFSLDDIELANELIFYRQNTTIAIHKVIIPSTLLK